MRIPIALVALILTAAAILGWNDHRKLVVLRSVNARLSEQAAARGVAPDASGRNTRRQREDTTGVARKLAAEFIAAAREARNPVSRSTAEDETAQKQAEERSDRMMTLDGGQLKVVIAELRAATDVDEGSRLSYICGLVLRLGRDHPEDAATLLMENPEMLELIHRTSNGSAEHLISGIFRNWSSDNPSAAGKWFRDNGSSFSDYFAKMVPQALVIGAASSDPQRALQLVGDMELDAGEFLTNIARNTEPTTEHRKSVLAGLRGWAATETNGERRDQVSKEILPLLTFGDSYQPDDFNRATAWIKAAGLSPEEMRTVADSLARYAQARDLHRWMDWVKQNLPEESVPQPFGKLFSSWSSKDHEAAGAWLETAEDGPLKNAAILGYIDAVVENLPLDAARWIAFLPEGKEGTNRLWEIYRCWPPEDPQGKESFAKQHGLR